MLLAVSLLINKSKRFTFIQCNAANHISLKQIHPPTGSNLIKEYFKALETKSLIKYLMIFYNHLHIT